MSDILPVSTGIGFNNGNGFGADTMGAFAGALFGSWFGDAWGGNWGIAVLLVMLLRLAFQLRFLMMESMPSRTLLTT